MKKITINYSKYHEGEVRPRKGAKTCYVNLPSEFKDEKVIVIVEEEKSKCEKSLDN